MSLVRRQANPVWDPFREFQDLSDRLNRFFQGNPSNLATHEGEQALRGFDWSPAVNISETEKAYVIKADLPEVRKEDVKLTVEGGVLTLEGERRQQKKEENEKFHRVESVYGRFVRRFTLPDDVQDDKVEATFKDGALLVSIPKAAARSPKARQISVS
ncbi:MAG TPA: Hsp20/alpha crystallin family protein [Polyangiales bacterium]|nr:Hsp20/alpha crystallin family protein [Polyangiales bacterium]